MNLFRTVLAPLLLISLSSPGDARAQDSETRYEIERSQIVRLHSEALGRDYDLYIQLPRGAGTPEGHTFPVIFLNDADYAFPLVSSLNRQLGNGGRTEDVIIVGISYSIGDPGGLSRTRDYTPTHSPDEPVGHSAEAKQASGHAAEYLAFIRSEVFPAIAERFDADLSRAALVGHSFGGLFAAYVLSVAPETFKYYVISDPSLWYDDRVALDLVADGPGNDIAQILIVGSNPQPDRPAGPQNMVGNALVLSDLLTNRFGDDRVTTLFFEGEVHESVFPIAMTRALRLFFPK